MESIKSFFNGIAHPIDTMCYFLKNLIFGSKYIFIVICMTGVILYAARIKKGRDIAVGSIIIYAVLRVVAACL